MIKRRSFLKSIATVVFGGTTVLKAKEDIVVPVIRTASQAPVNPKITIGKSSKDICNEALEKAIDGYAKNLKILCSQRESTLRSVLW